MAVGEELDEYLITDNGDQRQFDRTSANLMILPETSPNLKIYHIWISPWRLFALHPQDSQVSNIQTKSTLNIIKYLSQNFPANKARAAQLLFTFFVAKRRQIPRKTSQTFAKNTLTHVWMHPA